MSSELDALRLFLLVDEGKVLSRVLISNSCVVGLEVEVSETKYSRLRLIGSHRSEDILPRLSGEPH